MERSGSMTLPVISAEQAELLYVSDDAPGYHRRRNGKGFCYIDQNGHVLKAPSVIHRLKSLQIPPAWEEVWICSRSNCHILATGRDSRRRKQYIYHPEWNRVRASTKFDRLVPFAAALPSIRQSIDRDLKRSSFSRETVLAFVVALLEETLIRIGNAEYERQNGSYGLTTLKDYHVTVRGSLLQLKFKGKRKKYHEIDVRNRRIARLAKRYQELPGQELLKYEDGQDGYKVIDSGDVNQYLREISGDDFTAKDFRTWGGTVFAATELHRLGPADSDRDGKAKISQALKRTAAKLGNTPTICRKHYIAPQIIESYLDRTLFEVMSRTEPKDGSPFALSPQENSVLKLLN